MQRLTEQVAAWDKRNSGKDEVQKSRMALF